MDKVKAKSEIFKIMGNYKKKPYKYWENLIGKEPICFEKNKYQVEIQSFWYDKRKSKIRVFFSIDDGGIRAYFPLSYDFIISKHRKI